ncbi:MAG TPA: nucleotide exchange factor GrpE [Bacteroidales bacterium]|nr:nucleotide exchange factor GrpE [Bacteroidales bacterium]
MTKKTKEKPEEKKNTKTKSNQDKNQEEKVQAEQEVATEEKEVKEEKSEGKKPEKTEQEIIAELNDKYLRLAAEYDNYRKRTLKEKMELTKTAGADILVNILPVMDDFERALGSMQQAKEVEPVKEGVLLIFNKFKEFLKQRGVKEIEAKEKDFDTDLHEAITKIPAPTEELKGKVVDVIEKGYFLNDKVIRFSKVVVGE